MTDDFLLATCLVSSIHMLTPHTPFSAELTKAQDVAQDTRLFSFCASEEQEKAREFAPGQFVLLEVDPKTHRAYSVASSPAQLPSFDLLIKRVPGGAASEKLWNAKTGDQLTFRGPMGKYALPAKQSALLLVATGTGFAPMRSFLAAMPTAAYPNGVQLLFGVRDSSYLFCADELAELAKTSNGKFSYHICFSQPKADETGDFFVGRVTDAFSKLMGASDFSATEAALCGSAPMVAQMKQLLGQCGMSPSSIATESW